MTLRSWAQKVATSPLPTWKDGLRQYGNALTRKKHLVRSLAYFTPMHITSTLVERGLMGLESDEMTQLRMITAASLLLGMDYAIEWMGKVGKNIYDKNGKLENSTHGEDLMNGLKFGTMTVGTSTALYCAVADLPLDQALAGGVFMGISSIPRGFFLEKSKKLYYGLHLGMEDTYDWIKDFSGKQMYKAKVLTYGALLGVTAAAYALPAHEWTWLSDQIYKGQEKIEENLEEKIKEKDFTL